MIIVEPDLSIIVGSCRPRLATIALYQLFNQTAIELLSIEIIVILEGDRYNDLPLGSFPGNFELKFLTRPVSGKFGAEAKDLGIRAATGNYVCFCDDDNYYRPDAIRILYDAVAGYDVGIAKTEQCRTDISFQIPREKAIILGDIDTMCCCVANEAARLYKWADYDEHTDYHWLKRIWDSGATFNFVDRCVGRHMAMTN